MLHDDARPGTVGPVARPPFRVLIVDADPALLATARTALDGLAIDGAGVTLDSVTSAAEARTALQEHPDTALILLEIALEGGRAGLELIAHLRRDLGNRRTRIVVCAAHPDAASEEEAITANDVSDWRPKAELTPRALRTAVAGQLRTFAGLQALAAGRKGLARMLVATTGLLEMRTPDVLFPNILPRVVGLLGIGHHALLCIQGDTLPRDRRIRVRAATGRFARWKDVDLAELGEPRVEAALDRLSPGSETIVEPDFCALRLRASGGITGMIYVEGRNDGTAREWQLLELFRNKCSIAFENALLIEELNTSQKATVLAMGALAEYKDNAATGHLQRMERLVGAIARELHRREAFRDELDADFVEKVGLAALLHDVGMLSVSDETLGMPGELTGIDMQMIQRHTEIGHRILAEAAVPLRGRSLLSIAAEIARCHHERYDGSGYREGLKGDAIPISARITAVADVFDALITRRQYRGAWLVEDAIAWIIERSGRDFDPRVVDAFVHVVRRFQTDAPDWFPRAEGSHGMLGGAIGRKLRALFGRRAAAM
ncbi:response regulator [Azospirillum sp. TSO35-2]|uniref:response regulator n=1 Tax=Azospirillum sp. TSO35-2 TaxID=716796 RepID=UPI000D619F4D|nr:response regulator [Azospirillum sp. TSO35-2]PWC36432.1 transcriptional regulator [Azospirillum sp. TSO35-2]